MTHLRSGSRRTLLVLGAGVLAAVLAIAALSSTARDPRRVSRVVHGTTTSPPARSVPPSVQQTRQPSRLKRRELAAIEATLRNTPVVTSGSARSREVALTFDDGPSQYTGAILGILKRKHAAATFFAVGEQVARYPRRLQQELRAGFAVGDHTENHAWLVHLDARHQDEQIGRDAARIKGTGGSYPRLFRPPYGAFDKATLRVLRRSRMLLVLWSVDPGDWRRPGADSIVANVLHNARRGAIVLLHDGGGYRDQTVAALPAIIDGLRRRHYVLVTVPRLILDDPPSRHARVPPFTGA